MLRTIVPLFVLSVSVLPLQADIITSTTCSAGGETITDPTRCHLLNGAGIVDAWATSSLFGGVFRMDVSSSYMRNEDIPPYQAIAQVHADISIGTAGPVRPGWISALVSRTQYGSGGSASLAIPVPYAFVGSLGCATVCPDPIFSPIMLGTSIQITGDAYVSSRNGGASEALYYAFYEDDGGKPLLPGGSTSLSQAPTPDTITNPEPGTFALLLLALAALWSYRHVGVRTSPAILHHQRVDS